MASNGSEQFDLNGRDSAATSSALNSAELADLIELMVEGELEGADRSRLLLYLDEAPQRWKMLALAYVEQQRLELAVRSALQSEHPESVADEIEDDDPETRLAGGRYHEMRVTTARSIGADQRSYQRVWLTAAAGVLLAFLAGLVTGEHIDGEPSQAGGFTGRLATTVQIADASSLADATSAMPLATSNTPAARVAVGSQVNGSQIGGNVIAGEPVGYVEWVGRFGPVQSPVFPREAIDKKWLQMNPPKISPRLQASMAEAGWRVAPARKLVSLRLSDGAEFMIPMDDLTCSYVGKEVF